jgi:uncharacterized SAM-binding protein YcdF (DUF218 family)
VNVERSPILRKLARTGIGVCVLFTLLFCSVTFLPILEPWIGALSAPWSNQPMGTLIVLAGDANADHVLGLTSYWRAVYAVFEWRRGGYDQIIFSGGEGYAESMRDFAVAQGVPAAVIRLERRSLSTHENALFVAEMLRGSGARKILLTSDYHSRRAWMAFRKAGLDVTARPFPDARKRAGSPKDRWGVMIELCRETVKYIYYQWHGWI